jgi:hypothetical protein
MMRNPGERLFARSGPLRNVHSLSVFPSGVRFHSAGRAANCQERDRVFDAVMRRVHTVLSEPDPKWMRSGWRDRLARCIESVGVLFLRLAERVRGA